MQNKNSSELESRNMRKGYLLVAISTFCFALTAIFIRELNLTYKLPALVLAFWRNFLAVLILLLGFLIFKRENLRLEGRHFGTILLVSISLFVFNLALTLSVVENGPSIGTVMVFTSVPFTAIFGYWFLKESLGWFKLLMVVLTLVGCAVISLPGTSVSMSTTGLIVGLISGFSYGMYSLFVRKAAQEGINPWTTVLYSFMLSGAGILLVNLLPWKFLPGLAETPQDILIRLSPFGWVLIIGLALVPTILGYGTYNNGVVYLPASTANMMISLEPVITAIVAYFLFHERLTWLQILGGLLIIGAVIMLRWYESRAKIMKT